MVATTGRAAAVQGGVGQKKPPHTDRFKSEQHSSQDAFLSAYATTGGVSSACRASGVGRATVYDWERADTQGFVKRFESARFVFRESLEQQMYDRLSDPTGNRGSDVLLIFALKAVWGDKYKDNIVLADDTSKEMLAQLRRMQRDADAKRSNT